MGLRLRLTKSKMDLVDLGRKCKTKLVFVYKLQCFLERVVMSLKPAQVQCVSLLSLALQVLHLSVSSVSVMPSNNRSPTKKLRSTRRMFAFILKKTDQRLSNQVSKLSSHNILSISISESVLTDIPPSQKPIMAKYSYKHLVMDLSSQQTDFSTYHNTRPIPVLPKGIPQLDGGTMDYLDPPRTSPDLQCKLCKKTFENTEDFNWHNETKIGCEDCSILRIMLDTRYYPY